MIEQPLKFQGPTHPRDVVAVSLMLRWAKTLYGGTYKEYVVRCGGELVIH